MRHFSRLVLGAFAMISVASRRSTPFRDPYLPSVIRPFFSVENYAKQREKLLCE